MYPFLRLTKEMLRARRMPQMPLTGTHISNHIIWPWDIDMFGELNNGRTLTIYDLGRIPLAARLRFDRIMLKRGWAFTILGCSMRWRHRVLPFARVTIKTKVVGWEDRYIYVDQSMWLTDGRCANQALFRSAIVGKEGVIPTDVAMESLGLAGESPNLPDWVNGWIAADATRPWPPLATRGDSDT